MKILTILLLFVAGIVNAQSLDTAKINRYMDSVKKYKEIGDYYKDKLPEYYFPLKNEFENINLRYQMWQLSNDCYNKANSYDLRIDAIRSSYQFKVDSGGLIKRKRELEEKYKIKLLN